MPFNYIIVLMSTNIVHEMKGTQFPFGVLNVDESQLSKTLIKKKYLFKDHVQCQEMTDKIGKLKGISHKNAINLRSAVEDSRYKELFYQYVPYSLQDYCLESQGIGLKQLHKQFIQLAIFLAKNCITTSFSPNRCGIIHKEGIFLLKYYLPLPQISITSNRSTLERFVQLFNVQSMQHLDHLLSQTSNNANNQTSSQRTFKNRVKLFPMANEKMRKESQPTGNSRDRRASSNVNNFQKRRLSSLSKELSEINQIHKRHKASTRVSGGSFNTFQSFISFQSQAEIKPEKSKKCSLNDLPPPFLKRCLSDSSVVQAKMKVDKLISRSKKAIEILRNLESNILSYNKLHNLLERVHYY